MTDTQRAQKSQSSGVPDGIKGLNSFWPYYMREHRNLTNQRLHFFGTLLTFVCLYLAISQRDPMWLFAMPVVGYGFAWTGHFVFEKNRPATFKYPLMSLICDYRMFFVLLRTWCKKAFTKN